MTSILELIEDLDLGAAREVLENQGYPIAADASLKSLQAAIADDYERDLIGGSEIRAVVEDREDRLAAPHEIIAAQNNALAAARAEIENLGGSGQFLVVALRRDARGQ